MKSVVAGGISPELEADQLAILSEKRTVMEKTGIFEGIQCANEMPFSDTPTSIVLGTLRTFLDISLARSLSLSLSLKLLQEFHGKKLQHHHSS